MDKDLFKNHADYWLVAENIKDIYMSEGTLLTLLDFERVLDELDIYAFKNWIYGELVSGPEIKKYTVSCIFMYPKKLMPDPRGGLRLLPFDCQVKFRLTEIKIPIKIQKPSDYRAGTHKAKMIKKPVWLVEITIPKNLISDIRTGSIELEDQDIDMQDIEDAYSEDLDKEQYQSDPNENNQNAPQQPAIPPQ
jgi:hypothetical protein